MLDNKFYRNNIIINADANKNHIATVEEKIDEMKRLVSSIRINNNDGILESARKIDDSELKKSKVNLDGVQVASGVIYIGRSADNAGKLVTESAVDHNEVTNRGDGNLGVDSGYETILARDCSIGKQLLSFVDVYGLKKFKVTFLLEEMPIDTYDKINE